MLWVDKYRPVQLDRLSFHHDLTAQLRRMACKENVGNMSHLMFYGPSGAGKKTRVMALLREASARSHLLPPIHVLTTLILDLWLRGGKDEGRNEVFQIQVINGRVNFHQQQLSCRVESFGCGPLSASIIYISTDFVLLLIRRVAGIGMLHRRLSKK